MENHVARGGRDDQIAGRVGRHLLGSAECQIDRSRVRRGSDHEIELQFTLLTMINKVDAWIDVLINDASVLRNIGLPLLRIASQIVIALSRQMICRRDLSAGIFANQPHTNHGRRFFLCAWRAAGVRDWDASAHTQFACRSLGMKCEHRVVVRQKERVSISPSHVLNLRISLSLIRFEG